jgi:NADH-quinone oxidoreductase subunit N
VKAAAFAAIVRVFLSAFAPLRADWVPLVWMVTLVTMVVGTVVGVAQTNAKRMLAYSSIAHAGYLLVGLVAANSVAKAAILYYLAVYALTNVGAFGVIALIATRDRPNGELRDFAGLWHTHPGLTVLMTVFLLSLGGFPPTAGFIAKWYVFAAAVQEGYYGLAIIGVLTSVVSVYFYLKIVVNMYMSDVGADYDVPQPSWTSMIGLGLAAIGIFYLGILPSAVIELATRSVETIF